MIIDTVLIPLPLRHSNISFWYFQLYYTFVKYPEICFKQFVNILTLVCFCCVIWYSSICTSQVFLLGLPQFFRPFVLWISHSAVFTTDIKTSIHHSELSSKKLNITSTTCYSDFHWRVFEWTVLLYMFKSWHSIAPFSSIHVCTYFFLDSTKRSKINLFFLVISSRFLRGMGVF